MKNKKKRGFTLIELLAIIVILAIVAVITIPILLNVIENSRKGAAKDSAYGYKDAINKFYLEELAKDQNWNELDGDYTINSDGNLVKSGVEPYVINTSGDKPTSGGVLIENKKITQACLQLGDYAVEIVNGDVKEAVKGECSGNSIASSSNSGQGGSTTTKSAQTLIAGASSTINEDGLIQITHTNSDVDYRYMGKTPDNYIYFNCSSYDVEDQDSDSCEVWRIIGIFNNQLKIVKDTALSSAMEWDSNYSNNWKTATLNTYLNGDYYNTFNSTTKELISSSTWYLGGWGQNGSGNFSEGAYLAERGSEVPDNSYLPASTTANVGLIYPSDYGFASSGCYSMCAATDDSRECGESYETYNLEWNENGMDYSNNNCTSTNWLYDESFYWTLTPGSGGSYSAWLVYNYGLVRNGGVGSSGFVDSLNVHYTYGVRPSIYLDSDIDISGTGASDDPYKIIK